MDVETGHAVADVRIAQRQRQADIAEADDPDGCGLLLELLDHFGCHHKALKLSPVAGGGDHPTSPRTRSASLSDRKSVVEGKSVSVRVDLGGRRSIKNKKQINNRTTSTICPSLYINYKYINIKET